MDRVYFNDEWNEPIPLSNEEIMNHQIFYRECYRLFEEQLKKEFIKIGKDGKTYLPKEYKNNERT